MCCPSAEAICWVGSSFRGGGGGRGAVVADSASFSFPRACLAFNILAWPARKRRPRRLPLFE